MTNGTLTVVSPPESQVGESTVAARAYTSRQLIESKPPVTEMFRHNVQIVRVLAGPQWVSGGSIIRPIRVEIRGSSENLTVSDVQTGIFGVGPDLPSALQDFRSALVEHRDVLESSQSLSEELQRHLSILRRHLRP